MSEVASPVSVLPEPAPRRGAARTSDPAVNELDADQVELTGDVVTDPAGLPAPQPVVQEPLAPVSPGVETIGRFSGESLRSRAIKGGLWTTGGYGAAQVLRLGTNLVLTRLLQPHMFGVMTLVNIFMQGLQGFSDLGIGPSIIQNKRGDDPDFLNTAWTMQSLRGVALGCLSAVIAWPVASLYGEPQLLWLLPVAGLTAVIAGFNSTALFTLNRHLDVRRLTIRSLVGQVVGAGVMIAWALARPSIWALVAGTIAASLANLALSHTLMPSLRNRFRWDRSAASELMKFGRWIFVSTMLTFLALQADRLIFGKLIPMHELGVYGVAAMMAALPTAAILKLGGTVVFPAYSRAKATGANFQRVFDRVRLPLLAFGGMAAAGMIAAGRPVIELLYDPRYHAAGWMLQLLAMSAWLQVLQVTNGSALLALGSPKWVAAGNVVKLTSMVICIPLGFWARGLPGAVAAIMMSDVLKYAVSAIAARRKGLYMLGKDLLLSALVVLSAGAALALQYAGRTGDGRRPVPATVLAIAVAGLVVGAVWVPVIVHSLRSRKVVA